jgi:hypothetical protein
MSQSKTEMRVVTKPGIWRGKEMLEVGKEYPFTPPHSAIVERRTRATGKQFTAAVEQDNDTPDAPQPEQDKPQDTKAKAADLIEQIKTSEDFDFLEEQFADERKSVSEAAEKRLKDLGAEIE